jgi:hypothetical protein
MLRRVLTLQYARACTTALLAGLLLLGWYMHASLPTKQPHRTSSLSQTSSASGWVAQRARQHRLSASRNSGESFANLSTPASLSTGIGSGRTRLRCPGSMSHSLWLMPQAGSTLHSALVQEMHALAEQHPGAPM